MSTSIVSRKSPDFNEPIKKVFVIIDSKGKAHAYFASIKNLLFSEFSKRKIHSKLITVNPLSLDEEEYREELESYQPDAVMFINMTGRDVNDFNHNWLLPSVPRTTGVYLDIQIFPFQEEKPVWRASMKEDGNSSDFTMASRNTVWKLVRKLEEDGMIE